MCDSVDASWLAIYQGNQLTKGPEPIGVNQRLNMDVFLFE